MTLTTARQRSPRAQRRNARTQGFLVILDGENLYLPHGARTAAVDMIARCLSRTAARAEIYDWHPHGWWDHTTTMIGGGR